MRLQMQGKIPAKSQQKCLKMTSKCQHKCLQNACKMSRADLAEYQDNKEGQSKLELNCPRSQGKYRFSNCCWHVDNAIMTYLNRRLTC